MTQLTAARLPGVQQALRDADLDGWLLYDFRGLNPVAVGMLGLEGFASRRAFGWVPADGSPAALSHPLDHGAWRNWPAEWQRMEYRSWRTLEEELAKLLYGKRVAMEYSSGDAVPYLDRVPAGVVEMIRVAGATVVSSADLVTAFYAVWTDEHRRSHERAAEVIAGIARDAVRLAAGSARSSPITEFALHQWILERFSEAGLQTDHGPIVAVNANAADPHYEPKADASASIDAGSILLVDLWAREADGVFADQTWMASLGEPSQRALAVWSAVREARDAAIGFLSERVASGEPAKGADVDDVARGVIERHGFGDRFLHRTGHSIDAHDLHGSGPHLDNLETREERVLISGVGFSIEPGIYIPGEIGMRTEVNAFIAGRELLVTPRAYQRELLVV